MRKHGFFSLVLASTIVVFGSGHVSAQNISVDPTSWDFGPVVLGNTATIDLQINSLAPTELTVFDVEIIDDATGSFFNLNDPFFPTIVPVGEFITVEIAFTPSTIGLLTANVDVVSNAPIQHTLVPVQGTGKGPTEMPEPLTLLLISLGLAGIGYQRRKQISAV